MAQVVEAGGGNIGHFLCGRQTQRWKFGL
jgi:hypothetical protein